MSDERTSPGTLAYRVPERRVRRKRRVAAVAVFCSALVLATVGSLLYSKVSPILADRFRRWSAQSEVLRLKRPGIAIDATTQPSFERSAGFDRLEHAARRWRNTFYVPATGWPGIPSQPSFLAGSDAALVYAGPIRNAAGVERMIDLAVNPFGNRNFAANTSVFLGISVRERVTLMKSERPLAHYWQSDWLMSATRAFHLDAPSLDSADAKRLFLTGTVDDRPFSYELTLDANDRLHCFDLRASHATTLPAS